MADAKICSECGAVLPEGAEQCGLCGTPAAEADVSDAEAGAEDMVAEENAAPEEERGPGNEAGAQGSVFCHQCGWENPPGANFCSRCGHALQPVEAAEEEAAGEEAMPPPGTQPAAPFAEAEEDRPTARTQGKAALPSAADDGLWQRVVLIVGVAALLIAGLYTWSSWSGGREEGAAPEAASASGGAPPAMRGGPAGAVAGGGASRATRSGGVPAVIRQQQTGDVPSSIAARADSLRQVIEARGGKRGQLARHQLARLYAGAGLTPRAAAQQWQLAQESGSPAAWERAGSMLYDWMASLERGQQRAQVAQLTVDAYQRVLQDDPDNFDVRTNLAVAYLSTNNPMRGISEIKRVLRENPDHVGARFNYGLMQMWIGRNATAIEQFERVRETAGKDSPYYQQAAQVIQRIKEKTGGAPQDAPKPGGAPPAMPGS